MASVKSIADRIESAKKRIETLETLSRIESADPHRILETLIDGIRFGKDVDIDVVKSIARSRWHWTEQGKLVQLRNIVDGELKITYRYLTFPSPTEAESIDTWKAIGEKLRVKYYRAAELLGMFMPMESDRAVSLSPLATDRRD